MKSILPILVIVLLLAACHKTDHRLCCAMPDVEMTRKQTQCADPWGYGRSNEEAVAALKNYLLHKNITVSRIEIVATGETVSCLACTCSNGNEFHVWSPSRYIDSLKSEGFIIK